MCPLRRPLTKKLANVQCKWRYRNRVSHGWCSHPLLVFSATGTGRLHTTAGGG